MAEAYARELEIARRAVERAGAFTLEHFGTRLEVERKADLTPVTIADRGAEERLRADLAAAFPTDGFLGEEFGEQEGRSGRRWIVDPIDGTQSFIRGVPLYGVLVGLEEDGACVLGVMGFPALRETYWAARGAGAFRNGEGIQVSTVATLGDATVLAGDSAPAAFGERNAGYQRLLARAGRQRGWGDCYGYALVASGRAEVMLDPVASAWDLAAIAPIITEAGGAFSDWSGEPTIYGGSAIAVSSALRAAVLDALHRDA
jgi:myo-inositol-1(or 4)-monophosphatase